MLEFLNQLDTSLFYFVNIGWQNPVFDWLMPFITAKENWYPLWLIVIIGLAWKGGKKGRTVVLLIIPLIVLSDQLSANIFKNWIQRVRPCVASAGKNEKLMVDAFCSCRKLFCVGFVFLPLLFQICCNLFYPGRCSSVIKGLCWCALSGRHSCRCSVGYVVRLDSNQRL